MDEEVLRQERIRIETELDRVFGLSSVVEDISYDTDEDSQVKWWVRLDLRGNSFTFEQMMKLPAVFGTTRLNFSHENGCRFAGSDVTPPDTFVCFTIEVLKEARG